MSMIGKAVNCAALINGPQTKSKLNCVSAERMCAERVEQVRAEYDQILQQKLSEQVFPFLLCIDRSGIKNVHKMVHNVWNNNDSFSPQYDAFVKFIDHQIQKRFNESMAPSYLS